MSRTASPTVVLSALAQARAYLAREGEYTLDEAEAGVNQYAEALGVPDYIVQMIVAEEFAAARLATIEAERRGMFKMAAENDGRLEPDE